MTRQEQTTTMTRAELEQEIQATERELLVAKRYGRDDLVEQATAKLADLAEIGLEMDHTKATQTNNTEEETTMTNTKMLQGIAQEMAEMQKAMEKSGDADPVWTTEEIARQNMADCWDAIAGAWDIEDIDAETRDRLWDMVVEAYFGPTTPTTKTLWGGYYYETDGRTYWKTGENWDTERVEISEAEYNEAMADRQDYYDHRDVYDNDEQLLWDIETEAAIEEETGHPMTTVVETDTTSPATREQLVASLETEKDPIGAVIAYIRDHMAGLVRHDLDAKNNGWDPYEYPENGYIWHEAESILLEAAGVEDLDDIEGIYDDAYADLVDAIGTLLEGDEDMAIEALVEAWDETVDEGFGEIEMAQSLIEQIEGTQQGWDASVEDAEDHPDIALMIGLDPEAEPEDPDEMEDLWETWGRVVGEAARRWLARHPEAARTAREEE